MFLFLNMKNFSVKYFYRIGKYGSRQEGKNMKKAERWKKKLELLVIIFVLMSFAGWIWEVAIHLVERNFCI